MDTTNEPVAWMRPDTLECGHGGNVDWEDTGCIPIYTHPVKELTDEEILNLFEHKYDVEIDDEMLIDFARAILRKAQESCNGFCGEYECKENKAGCKRKAQEK